MPFYPQTLASLNSTVPGGRPPVIPLSGYGRTVVTPTSVVAYAGPGDIVGGAIVWVGLRAYSLASIGSNVVQVRRSSDATTKTFVSIAGGGINTADAFFDGSTYTISTLYDQSGNGRDLAQATVANQPLLILSGLGSLPVIRGDGNRVLTFTNPTQVAPNSYSHVEKCTNSNAQRCDIWSYTSGTGGIYNILASSNTKYQMYSGAFPDNTLPAANSWTAVLDFFNGSSSQVYFNGTGQGTVNPGTGNVASGTGELMASAPANPNFLGDCGEWGWWGSDISSNASALSAQQRSYWGF